MPGYSALVERIVLPMDNAWSDERGRMNENTLQDVMVCKINFVFTFNEFYEKIKNNIAVLKIIHSTEKYQY